jgi:EAL domain-containing protein (putative c-di-GMP-specific phosphodiesterase class I)
MPTGESAIPIWPRPGAPACRAPASRQADAVTTIRGQARTVIEKVLADSAPEGEPARARLRALVAAHPGNPEQALLEHLMVTGALANPAGTRTGPGAGEARLPGAPSHAPGQAPPASIRSGRKRIAAILGKRLLVTAFQPICALPARNVVGAEALTRFVAEDGASADHWFAEAAAVGLGADLEFAALNSALAAAQELPPHLYVALNLSPATCLDPRLSRHLERSGLGLDRMVLELSERIEVQDHAPLTQALAPLRRRGLRIAADDAGDGLFSLQHVIHLHPDIIKLDRVLTARIEDSPGQQALAASLVDFSAQTGSIVVAEGIETHAELTTVTTLGITAGQGYFLGRPSVRPREWARWRISATASTNAEHPATTR